MHHYCHVLFLYVWFLFSINFKAICVYQVEFHFQGISLVFWFRLLIIKRVV